MGLHLHPSFTVSKWSKFKIFPMKVPRNALYQNSTNGFAMLNKMATKTKNRKIFKWNGAFFERKVKQVYVIAVPVICLNIPVYITQGPHRLEKYLNLKTFLKSPWKLNLPWKVLENHSEALKRPWILLFSVGLSTVDRDLIQYKIDVPLFGAVYAALNIGTPILY